MDSIVSIDLLQLLLLIVIANGVPILIRAMLGDVFNIAVDFGRVLPDGQPVLGPSKTWRGIIAAFLTTPVAAWLLGYSPETGLLVAFYAVIGDLTSSFIKRRLGMASSSMALLLDQIPESLLPAFMTMEIFNLDFSSVLLLVVIFIITELALSKILYHWGLRKRPY